MDMRKFILYVSLGLVTFMLWSAWKTDYPPPINLKTTIQTESNEQLLPQFTGGAGSLKEETSSQEAPFSESSKRLIHVTTDVLSLQLDLNQGDVVDASLLQYPSKANQSDKPFQLLNNDSATRYVANSSLFIVNEGLVKPIDFNFQTEKTAYVLNEQDNTLVVTLTGKTPEGLKVDKTFTFKKGSYLIEIAYKIKNDQPSPWTGYMSTQLLRKSPEEDKSSPVHVGSYTGASYSNPAHHRYQKVTFKDMEKHNLDTEVDSGWIAMQQRYFLTAFIPDMNTSNTFYSRSLNDTYTIGFVSKPISLKPAEQQLVHARLYLGPEIADSLKAIAPNLDLTIDYGWLWFIASFLFSLMKGIYAFVGNWGWSIILVTVIVKLAFYRLQSKSYRSMAGMRQLQPKLQALRERYGDDKAKISQATMELYRQEKVNPLSGCLPLVVQFPVMIALYWVMIESVELRQAPFLFWIKDLAASDPYHVLPLVMGLTMFVQQKLNPAPPDPMQAKVMMFLPVLFTGLFWNFPSGLVLYWTVNNTLTVLQQWYITRKFSDQKPPVKKSLRLVK
ncbi:MAG: membrane protein insertase YidC [Legionellaceae bacterium]